MSTHTQKWGNSAAVRLPKIYVKQYNLDPGAPFEFKALREGLLIKPKRKLPKRISLKKLLTGMTPENRHEPIDWGPPVGKEVW